jgi:hypothetical protein
VVAAQLQFVIATYVFLKSGISEQPTFAYPAFLRMMRDDALGSKFVVDFFCFVTS